MESNGQTERTSKLETDSQTESRMTFLGPEDVGLLGVEGLNKKEIGLKDNSVGIVAVRRVKGG